MVSDQSLLGLFTQASPLVKGVMLLLLSASLVSWTLIFQRFQLFREVQTSIESFEQSFWSGIELNPLYQKISTQRGELYGEAAIFMVGFKEFLRLRKHAVHPDAVMDGVQRVMRVTLSREVDRLETHLPFLATVGSVSPYVGLFGTVWGIMNSFRALGSVQQASLAMVAPGISEALVATAIGLFAAIPAVIAYNRYAQKLQSFTNHYQAFLEEFTSILHRQVHAPQGLLDEAR